MINSDVCVQVTGAGHLRDIYSFFSLLFLATVSCFSLSLLAIFNLKDILLSSSYINSYLNPPGSTTVAQESALGKRDFKTLMSLKC